MIWTIEIAGRPVMAVSAANRYEAQMMTEDEWFLADLMVMEDERGQPLWDESEEISVREANRDETKKWDWSVNRAVQDGEIASRDEAISEGYNAYLIPVRDPTGDDFDD